MRTPLIVAALVAAVGSVASGQVLYDNGPLVSHPGAACQGRDSSTLETVLGINVYGFGWTGTTLRIADDFTVPAGQTWNVTGFEFFAYQTNATSPGYTTVTIQILNGPPNNPASQVIAGDTTTNRLSSPATFMNIMRPTDTNMATECNRQIQRLQCSLNATLPAGTYWVNISGGPSGFMPPVTIQGQPAKPGANGMQFTATGWGNLAGTTGTINPVQDIAFLVRGTQGGGCYPDCNGDGTLNLADFGCFQTKFALGDPYADCNGDGTLNLADFGCFQTKFALGCP